MLFDNDTCMYLQKSDAIHEAEVFLLNNDSKGPGEAVGRISRMRAKIGNDSVASSPAKKCNWDFWIVAHPATRLTRKEEELFCNNMDPKHIFNG